VASSSRSKHLFVGSGSADFVSRRFRYLQTLILKGILGNFDWSSVSALFRRCILSRRLRLLVVYPYRDLIDPDRPILNE
jgi:hypothetical protein